jgi:hypothetical protein
VSLTALETHPNETLNRQERAFRLTRLALQYRLRTKQVEAMTEDEWNLLGSAARINLPVGVETKALVVELLKLARTPVLAHSSKLL